MTIISITLLSLNALWFGAAFWSFAIRSQKASRMIVPREARKEQSCEVVVHALKFLGGMNLAFCALSIVLLMANTVFNTDQQKSLLALIFSLAHGTQFYFNLPLALKEAKGQKPIWPVLKGTMRFIFLIDGTLCLANLIYGLAILI